MAYRHQGLSRTLPKNFTFPSLGVDMPKTPEPTSTEPDGPPPPPRHSSCRQQRFRARSGTDVFAQAEYSHSILNTRLSDIPLPSIEFPPTNEAPTPEPRSTLPANDNLLAPPRDRQDMKTPPAQIRTTPIDPSPAGPWPSWEYQDPGNSIKRPDSVCSNASNSSVSSVETLASHHSVGGSCTSMESELQDPFWYLETPRKQLIERPPMPTKSRALPKERWTLEMDNHLWNTYQLYLQDPTITPFKMTPGSIPPLGVTHRVAREAKRTWGKRRLGQFSLSNRSRNATPTGKPNSKVSWPRSETSTRRRLKLLCKRKFSIAPHYQRMMQSRSPTPFFEAFARTSRESSRANTSCNVSTPYTTRDLGVSLVSTSAPGPLALWAAEENPHSSNSDPFGCPLYDRSQDIDPRAKGPLSLSDHAPRLGSPFKFQTWGPSRSRRKLQANKPTGRRETIHVTRPRLPIPARFDPLPNVHDSPRTQAEDQANVEESSPMNEDTRHRLDEIFSQGKLNEKGQRRVRIRSRGATTSAVNSNHLEQLFSPPSSSSAPYEEQTPAKPSNPFLSVNENIKRLGSPFKVDGLAHVEFPARNIKHAPSLSDPFMNLQPQPDQDRNSLPSDRAEERRI